MTQKSAFLSRFTPSLMPAEALEGIFVQRQELAQLLLERIRRSAIEHTPHHALLVGPRGIGKTHLISLIYYRVKQSADLQELLLTAWLREEEWQITSFLDMLLRILQALAAEHEEDPALGARVNALYNLTSEKAETAAADALKEAMHGRSLLILMENTDELLLRMGAEGKGRLQRFLRENPHCVVLASSQSLPDGSPAARGTPLPGDWLVHQLEELTQEDAVGLLTKIAAYRGDRQLSAFISSHRGLARVRALKYLAGGNHRAYVIFSQFLTRESLDELIEPLMRTIDDLTPYYQSRMAWLSPQQRKIIAFICECRHPMPLRDIARHCFIKPDTAASQLEGLRKIGHVHSFTVGSDTYYELREPLMRLSIEVKKHRGKPVRLLVDFLRLWYSPAELQQRFASLPDDAALERDYAIPALQATGEEGEHPRVPACCAEYQAAVDRGDYARALRCAEELVVLRGRAEDLFARGFCLRSMERFEEAIACYDGLIAQNPRDALTWVLRGACLFKLGKCQDALVSCDNAIELNPGDARVWSDRGALLLNIGRPDEALASFDMALRLTQDDPFTWNSRGMALSDLGCFEEAAASFDKASELDRLDEMPCIYSCAAMIELKRFEPALARAERALSIAPEQPLAWAVCGAAQAGSGRHRDALASVERAIDLGECSSFVYFKRAEILLAQDRWREGAAALDEALRRFHSSGNPDTGNTVELVRILESHVNDENGLQLRAKVLVLVYFKHHALPALAHATVECIPDLTSPAFEDVTAKRWLETWRSLTGTQSEFRLPLRLIDAAVTYRETQDLRVLMGLPLEERVLLEPLLGIQVQATA